MDRPPFGLYLHVPYCASICGYCDFNTYVARRGDAGPRGHVDSLLAELELAAAALAGDPREVSTVFVGGGTPTLLGASELVRLLHGVQERLPLAAGAEVTTEANPETVDERALAELRAGGFTRVSIGMQSAAPHVLASLERVHTPGASERAARDARAAGFEHVSLDLIYGTPGETADDWRRTLDAALSAGPDHVSAYALIVEPGTRLGAAVAAGRTPAPNPDLLADRYEQADAALSAAGLGWYEISNWAAGAASRSRHNDGYWSGGDWWGAGPGAHSTLGGVRWWNERSPRTWAQALAEGRVPEAGRETPDEDARRLERVMLGIRRVDGLATGDLDASAAEQLAADGLLDPAALAAGRAVLTLRGRLLADRVTLTL